MKRAIILLIIIIPILVYGKKKPVSGIYKDMFGQKIHIVGDTFKFIGKVNNVTSSDVFRQFAECDITWIGDNLMELNSPDPISIALKSMKITQSTINHSTNDSIKIAFDIPYKYNRLKISLGTDIFKTFVFYFSEENKEIMLPNSIKKIGFTIQPEEIRSVDIYYSGLIYFHTYLDFEIKDNANYIKIDISALDNHYFEKYYIKGEYARIVGNKIIWRGEVFKKMKE